MAERLEEISWKTEGFPSVFLQFSRNLYDIVTETIDDYSRIIIIIMTALILLYFYAILLIFPLFRHEFSSATTVPNTPDDAELLLKMARDYR